MKLHICHAFSLIRKLLGGYIDVTGIEVSHCLNCFNKLVDIIPCFFTVINETLMVVSIFDSIVQLYITYLCEDGIGPTINISQMTKNPYSLNFGAIIIDVAATLKPRWASSGIRLSILSIGIIS